MPTTEFKILKSMRLYFRQPLKIIFFLFMVSLFLWGQGSGKALASDEKAWLKLESKYTIIHYQNREDLIKFDKNIDYSTGKQDLKTLFSSSNPSDQEQALNKKVDAIYRRVQKILDMRKRMKKKVIINIYQNKEQLQGVFYKLYKKRGRLRAWYIYEYNTIYLNLKDMHEGMLAHEMAHSIIDHYLTVRPPSASAEILARYVDKHLFKRR